MENGNKKLHLFFIKIQILIKSTLNPKLLSHQTAVDYKQPSTDSCHEVLSHTPSGPLNQREAQHMFAELVDITNVNIAA